MHCGDFQSAQFLDAVFMGDTYGLGAGSVDASLNNYVALHYASKHMSWLHCMWGLGDTGTVHYGSSVTEVRPGTVDTDHISVQMYHSCSCIQLSKWKKQSGSEEEQAKSKSFTS